MKSISTLAIGLTCLLLLTGCANKEKQLEGTWKFKSLDLPPAMANNPLVANAKQQLASSSLELKPEHKFTLNLGAAMEGTWTLADKTVTLTTTTVGGQSVADVAKNLPPQSQGQLSKPLPATLSDDGKTISLSQNGASMTFEKASS